MWCPGKAVDVSLVLSGLYVVSQSHVGQKGHIGQ